MAKRNVVKLDVTLDGLRPIMFDRYVNIKAKLSVKEKGYVSEGCLVLPEDNIRAFLASQDGKSCACVIEGKKRGEFIQACQAYASISPLLIPFLRDGKPIEYGGELSEEDTGSIDSKSGMYIYAKAPRVQKSGRLIPQDKLRPVLPLPWQLRFEIELWPNPILEEPQLRRWIVEGGKRIGLGTYRPRFGLFSATMVNI